MPFSVQIIGVLSPDDLSATSGDASMASSMTSSRDAAVYPDEDALLQIAERVHRARTNVTQTAEELLEDADQVCELRRYCVFFALDKTTRSPADQLNLCHNTLRRVTVSEQEGFIIICLAGVLIFLIGLFGENDNEIP